MRYDRKIRLARLHPGEFNPETGNFEDDLTTYKTLYASVMDTKSQMLSLVYGKAQQGSLTVIFQNHLSEDFDWIEINGKKYRADWRRKLRVKEALIVSEV